MCGWIGGNVVYMLSSADGTTVTSIQCMVGSEQCVEAQEAVKCGTMPVCKALIGMINCGVQFHWGKAWVQEILYQVVVE